MKKGQVELLSSNHHTKTTSNLLHTHQHTMSTSYDKTNKQGKTSTSETAVEGHTFDDERHRCSLLSLPLSY